MPAVLYCTACRTLAGEGAAVCTNCGNGFVSRLACSRCSKIVPAGYAYCPDCTRADGAIPPSPPPLPAALVPARPPSPLPALVLPPGLSLETAVVKEEYRAGRFGADAIVQMNGKDAEIMTKMNQVAMMLHALAAEMNQFQGMANSTRHVIRGCRMLAAELQEEVEVRRGPQ